MKKMYGMLILACSLILLAGCQKIQETNKNTDTITCQKYCEKGWKDDIQEQCYQDCKEIAKQQVVKNQQVIISQQTNIKTGMMNVTSCKNICSMTYGKAGSLTGQKECNDYCETALDPTLSCATVEKSGYIITTGLCIQQKAVEAQDPNYCGNIDNPGDEDLCYLELLRSTADKTLCDKIQDPSTKEYCQQRNRVD